MHLIILLSLLIRLPMVLSQDFLGRVDFYNDSTCTNSAANFPLSATEGEDMAFYANPPEGGSVMLTAIYGQPQGPAVVLAGQVWEECGDIIGYLSDGLCFRNDNFTSVVTCVLYVHRSVIEVGSVFLLSDALS
jgi:hypothetical protein